MLLLRIELRDIIKTFFDKAYISIVILLSLFADYMKRFATEEALREHDNVSTSSESSMSDFSEDEAQDMEL